MNHVTNSMKIQSTSKLKISLNQNIRICPKNIWWRKGWKKVCFCSHFDWQEECSLRQLRTNKQDIFSTKANNPWSYNWQFCNLTIFKLSFDIWILTDLSGIQFLMEDWSISINQKIYSIMGRTYPLASMKVNSIRHNFIISLKNFDHERHTKKERS